MLVKIKDMIKDEYKEYLSEFLDYDYERELEVKEVLTEEEKEYVINIIKPFKDRVVNIRKGYDDAYEFIEIDFKSIRTDYYHSGNDRTYSPYFVSNTMFVGMERDKEYTLGELGLGE